MENVMRRLTGLVTEGLVDVHIGRMVNSVDELRRGNWGRLGPYSNTVSANPPAPADTNLPPVSKTLINRWSEYFNCLFLFFPQITNEPVFYGPDGNVLSPEESKFLQDLTGGGPDIDEYG